MAAARKKIGILLYNQKLWTGGFYYTLNLIRSLQFLPDAEKPEVCFFYSGNLTDISNEITTINYPYVSYLPVYVRVNVVQRIINKFKRLIDKDAVLLGNYPANTVNYIYPCLNFSLDGTYSVLRRIHKIYWIPDFQDKYYPDFFSKEELKNRDALKKEFIEKNVPLVFSSFNAADDFKKFYPQAENNIQVLRFTSILPDMQGVSWEEVSETYNIDGSYFISPNQFWPHKNHNVVIDAVDLLVKKGINVTLLFTGKEFNDQAPEYAVNLKKKVADLGLNKQIKFLGFIDRAEQLLLMKHAAAVIQPSLFEGWSTVVEDTKAVGGRMIVSDLPIHREQCVENAVFFQPYDAQQLADEIITAQTEPAEIKKIDYDAHIRAFAQDFLTLGNLLN
ncbi:glycosyltransferase family 4 protein [Cytophaga hutchinsonii]|uniref:A-glycosyltransferase-related protein, glycosyltransferase family 4 protein n=1 Tax=Cytophaga hutchinsonii (strain ATCC 33406 / DSM 1761 / CIP 103989 / NBRC 15051 / NCIMB 9469 / D465) TaxID=269798 RepID=A0A6N4SPB9_CYTH3|nr:glycosyltransferase family 1 protein [Cytophaga hutchinsonii]ABG58134.1 a-glycosyltransferase-related protein, glycosyltransferase family 4 protein [Cytophaga hutchinsonii ATCC 33406]SFX14328.1 Glycosyltransferase involved in cell wall bisynthesis [Cytophaga hutchinsonii ATCC 33406]